MADILSMPYRSVFSKPKTDLTNLKFKSILCPNLEDIVLMKEDFPEAMKNLDPSSAQALIISQLFSTKTMQKN